MKGRFNAGFFCVTGLGGLYLEGLIFGILRYVALETSRDPEMLYFMDLKSSVWFTLGSEDKTMFCDTWNFFQLDCRSRFSKHLMAGSPFFSVHKIVRYSQI